MSDERNGMSDEPIRRWLGAQPEHAPRRAVDATIERLRETNQPRALVVRLSLPLAAAFVGLMVVAAGAAFWTGLGVRGPAPVASPSSAATAVTCTVETAVGGSWPVLLGRGFAPDTDVVLEVDRANGQHFAITVVDRAELHTDAQGRWGLTLPPAEEDIGRGLITASAGCSASVEVVVTAAQVANGCPDATNPLTEFTDTVAYRDAVAADTPAHWWHLDDASDAAIADAAGSATGARIGNVLPIGLDDGIHAQLFDGLGSYVSVPETRLPEFTAEAWVYLCGLISNEDAIVGYGRTSPDLNFFDGHLRLFDGTDDVVVAQSPAMARRWQHWAVTGDDAGTHIYLNGVLDATGPALTTDFAFNQLGRGDAGILRGVLDEVAIYDRALTADQIAAHAQAAD